jgi:hypothetical protein
MRSSAFVRGYSVMHFVCSQPSDQKSRDNIDRYCRICLTRAHIQGTRIRSFGLPFIDNWEGPVIYPFVRHKCWALIYAAGSPFCSSESLCRTWKSSLCCAVSSQIHSRGVCLIRILPFIHAWHLMHLSDLTHPQSWGRITNHRVRGWILYGVPSIKVQAFLT